MHACMCICACVCLTLLFLFFLGGEEGGGWIKSFTSGSSQRLYRRIFCVPGYAKHTQKSLNKQMKRERGGKKREREREREE